MFKRKWLSTLLVVAMVVMMLPVSALAAGTSADVSTKEEFLAALEEESITTINITSDLDLTDIPAGASNVIDISGRIIDLGGHTITANNFAVIYQGADFTIQNGTFDSNGGAYALFIGDEGFTNNVVVQNVTTNGGINVYNSTNVVLRDVDVTGGRYYAVWCDEGGQVKIENGVFQTNKENGTALLGMAEGNVDSMLNIEGGIFYTNGKPLVLEAAGKDYGDPVISGGTFDCSAKEYVSEGLEFERNSAGVYTYHETLQDALKDADVNTVITAVNNAVTDGTAYIATLVYNDGSGKVVQFVADAEGKIIFPSIERSGYAFVGWDKGDGNLIAAGQTYTLTENATFTGTWKEFTKVKTDAKAETCVKEGNIEYWYCPELKAYFEDEALTKPISLEDTVIPAKGHGETEMKNTKAATCIEEGYTGDKVCKDCGEILEKGKPIAKLAHTYKDGKCTVCGVADPDYRPDVKHGETEIRNAKAATCTEEGYTGDKVCKDCGEILEKGKPIAKLAHTYKDGKCTVCGAADSDYRPTAKPSTPKVEPSNNNPKLTDKTNGAPKTGDNSNIRLWTALLLVSCGGVMGAVVYNRKKKSTR